MSQSTSFNSFGLSRSVLDVLSKKGISQPTPIQAQCIPAIINGSDVLGIAQTGTGKTLAYTVPLVELMLKQSKQASGQVLVLVPTRELAAQVQETLRWFQHTLRLYSLVIIGGASMQKQLQDLKRTNQIIIATPGRLIDHLKQRTMNLKNLQYIVLDEADRMFDMGFAPQIKEIFKFAPDPQTRQTLLFSATMPENVLKLINEEMKEPVRIEVSTPGTTAEKVDQEMIIVDKDHRKAALLELLQTTRNTVIVFTRTKFQAKHLNKYLRQEGYSSEELHGNLSLNQRTKAIQAIQKKRSQILVATDVAGRGIDIPHVALVVNFELPDNPEDYVHRIGRTGRAGKSGKAVSFVLSDQSDLLHHIQKLINEEITQTHLSTVPSATMSSRKAKPRSQQQQRSQQQRNRRFGGSGGGRNRTPRFSSNPSGGGTNVNSESSGNSSRNGGRNSNRSGRRQGPTRSGQFTIGGFRRTSSKRRSS